MRTGEPFEILTGVDALIHVGDDVFRLMDTRFSVAEIRLSVADSLRHPG